ncbi:MAG: aspartate--tRNA ligase [Candidatus Omnitrophica bacterium]|nr:aspartate--tRNA ligase [Candidatus Omnitrophota bacterium]
MFRTHNNGELNLKYLNKQVRLCGWVHSTRDHGGLIFIDLRDRYGITQIVFNPQLDKALHNEAQLLRNEFVIMVEGEVKQRPKGTENPKIPTGEIEVIAKSLKVLNSSLTPPFEISETTEPTEELRLKYRYLDLRRYPSAEKIFFRHRVIKCIRDFLDKDGFVEVETPFLTKSTPEGARDYLVPSRLNPGKFFALPQSPQLFKQLLMVAGFERYYQIAKCFRDEDLRADRQPEFTQLDIEMSFIDEEDIFRLIEELVVNLLGQTLNIEIKKPFLKITYQDAINRYGTDKPDTRFDIEIVDLTNELKDSELKIFRECVGSGGRIKAIFTPSPEKFSNSDIDELIEISRQSGAAGLTYFKLHKEEIFSPIKKYVPQEKFKELRKKYFPNKDTLCLIIADKGEIPSIALGLMRLKVAQKLNLINNEAFNFLWVTEFPLFSFNKEENRIESEHHPFTSPQDEDIANLENDPLSIRSKAYDLVLNGMEIASGSIRIHNNKLQKRIFKLIGLSEEEAQKRFGFLLEAFLYGAPPHGGIAFGLDRLIAILSKCDTIRSVIAFPKTQKAICPLTSAPSEVDERQLKELNIKIRE